MNIPEEWCSCKYLAQRLNFTSANFYPDEVNQNRIRELLVQGTQAESWNLPFWHILSPSMPIKISQFGSYIFNLFGTVGAQKKHSWALVGLTG